MYLWTNNMWGDMAKVYGAICPSLWGEKLH